MRCKITQEFMATMLAAEARGEKVDHPAFKHFHNALFASVNSFIFKIAQRYVFTTGWDVQDIVHLFYAKILKEIHKYDYSRSKFSHWVWHVGVNDLNKLYHRNRKVTDHEFVVENEEDGNIIDNMTATSTEARHGNLLMDFSDAVEHMKTVFPDKKVLIESMFVSRNRWRNSLDVPHRINFKVASAESGLSVSCVHSWFRKHACVVLKERLSEYV